MTAKLQLLFCVADLGDSAFSVTIEASKTVIDLKEAILSKAPNGLKGVDTYRLTLYKVEIPDGGDLRQRAKDATKEELYAASRKLSEIFPAQPPEKTVNISVKVPGRLGSPTLVHDEASVLGKRSYVDDEDEGVLWLTEVHSKIWNRKDSDPNFFNAYWSLERNLMHYNLNPGVQIAKLHFLRSLTPVDASLPRYPNEDEDDPEIQSPDGDEDNDDPENQLLNSLFPSPLSTLDLSTLELKNVTRRLPSPLLLRQEYEHISKLIEREPRHSASSVIVSGQPGTGKTSYLFLRLIENLSD